MVVSPYVYPGTFHKEHYYGKQSLILKMICDYFGISEYAIKSPSRKKEIVKPRHIACYFMYQFTQASLQNIANEINRKDHSAIIHAINSVKAEMKTNKMYLVEVLKIRAKLGV